ncbi:hypothetical protein EGI22_18855 [Lacihabitans sp. LS3-19]|uniref:hypothetical protein n=1 Tax=Lacihabitans sp. LS3-19 TaxID=2487335 RepID=UPI0020CDB95A|nr:hypothetical protein [Lacihabitans sp. LS3-19]MCP9769969.1 hypothetical protein [Lacihabitans sp. LS3-19]
MLIDKNEGSYLFKHGFLDENVLALKIDSKEEYAFLVNENKYDGELCSLDKIADFLTKRYLDPNAQNILKDTIGISIDNQTQIESSYNIRWLNTDKGKLEIRTKHSAGYASGDFVYLNGEIAQDGKYVEGWPAWLNYVTVKDGKLK